MTDPLITKSPRNLCAGVAQHATGIASDMLSAYWSATEGLAVPLTFIKQTEAHLQAMTELLAALRATRLED